MPHAELPFMHLTGDWSAIPAEQALLLRLVAEMPDAPAPGADLHTRWNAATDTLYHIHAMIYDNRDAMFEGRESIQHETGKIMMVNVLGSVAELLHECARRATALRAGQPTAEADMTRWLDMFEPEIARLRAFLAEAAGGSGQAP